MRYFLIAGVVGLAVTLQACNQAEQPAADATPAAPAAMPNMPMPAPEAATAYTTTGEITAVAAGSVTINHQPVPELNWPSMTMGFVVPDATTLTGLEPGTPVEFSFREEGGQHVLTDIKRR